MTLDFLARPKRVAITSVVTTLAFFSLIVPCAPAQSVKIGSEIFLECQGDIPGPRFLDGRTGNRTVGLAPETGGNFTGTRWRVLDGGNGTVILECLGTVPGPRFLDGRTGNGTVGLAPQTGGKFTGTRWRVLQNGNDFFFECQGNIPGPRFLDGRTGNGTAGLAPETGGSFTGTRWRVLSEDKR